MEIASWNPSFAGQPMASQFSAGGTFEDCVGYIDIASEVGTPAQMRVEGWAWDSKNAAPFAHVVVTDSSGNLIGAGETRVDRSDVSAAMPAVVKNDRVGFIAFFEPSVITDFAIYGIDPTDSTVCLIAQR